MEKLPSSKPKARGKRTPVLDAAGAWINRQQKAAAPHGPDNDLDFYKDWGPSSKDGTGTLADRQHTKLSVYLARCGVCPRGRAASLISKGAVQIDGRTVDRNCIIRPGESITFQGRPIYLTEPRIWLYNKPRFQCDILQPFANDAEPGQVKRFVEAQRGVGLPDHVIPISGLSYTNKGLQVFTNDAHLAQQISISPVRQEFIVHINKRIPSHLLDSVRRGADIEGVHYPGLDIKVRQESERRSSLLVTIKSNKQQKHVRAMLRAIFCQIKMIKRIQYGPFNLKGLAEGTAKEVPVPQVWMQYLNPTWRDFAGGQFHYVKASKDQPNDAVVSLNGGKVDVKTKRRH